MTVLSGVLDSGESITSRSMHVEDSEFIAVSEGRIRIRIGLVIFLVALFLAVVRLGEIVMFSSSVKGRVYERAPAQYRANIVDRRGQLLATTLEAYALYVRPKYVWDKQETAQTLANLFSDRSVDEISERLSRRGDQILIRRALTPKQRQAAFDTGLPGLLFQSDPQRVYPRGQLASHVVGFAGVDMEGLSGAELAFNKVLTDPKAPPLALSLDLRVQHVASEELGKAIEKFEALTGAAIVLDINSGEVLALASLPNYDPNQPDAVSSQNLYNHATMSTYELGSVFKPITLAMALDENLTDLQEQFPVQNPIRIRGHVIDDDHPSRHPMVAAEILAQSSNRGTALMALRAGGQAQQDFLRKLGLLDRVDIELVESAAPQVQSEWQDITTVTVSYGHGISVTPLALAAATAALLNGGYYIAPTLLKRDAAHRAEKTAVIRGETSQTMRDLMRGVVLNGTGRNAAVPGYGVMGKTGSADKPALDGYDETRLVTSFIGAFPYENPSYLVLVTLDEPKAIAGTYGYATAGWNAAPTAGKIIERIAPMLGVPMRRGSEKLALASGGGQ